MKKMMILVLLMMSCPLFAQRGDTTRDTRVAGARQGAVHRAQNNEDPELKADLKKLSKEVNIRTAKLQEEYVSDKQKFPALTITQFHESKVLSVRENLSMDKLVPLTVKLGTAGAAVQELKKQP